MGNVINYTVKLKSDIDGLKNLKRELNNISKLTNSEYMDMNKSLNIQDAEKELKKLQSDASELKNILEKAYNTNLGTINNQKFNTLLQQNKINVVQLQQALSKMGNTGTIAFNNLLEQQLKVNTTTKETTKAFQKMKDSFENAVRYNISASVLNTVTGSISKAVNYVEKLDASLNDIRIVTGKSASEMERFAKQANASAKALGATTVDYSNAALIYAQQGLSEEEINKRTEITLKAANALGTSASEVSDYMTAIWNNYAKGSENLEYYADVLTKLGASTASSSEEIAQGLSKFSAVANEAGLSYEYATASLATVVAQTRESADTVGTAFKTIFSRLQGLKLGETLEDGVDLNKYSEALEKVGVQVLNSNGDLRDLDSILNDLGSKWDNITKAQKVALAETVAGSRQYNTLVALMDSWSEVQNNVNLALQSTGTLEEQNAIYLDSIESHVNKTKAAAEELYKNLIDEDLIKFFTDLGRYVLDFTNLLTKGTGGGLSTLSLVFGKIGQIYKTDIAEGLINLKNNFKDITKELNKNSESLAKLKKDYNEFFDSQQGGKLNEQSQTVKSVLKLDNAYSKLSNPSSELREMKNNLIGESLKSANLLAIRDELNQEITRIINESLGQAMTQSEFESKSSGGSKSEEELARLARQLEEIGRSAINAKTALSQVFNGNLTDKQKLNIFSNMFDTNFTKERLKIAFPEIEEEVLTSIENLKQEINTALNDNDENEISNVLSKIISPEDGEELTIDSYNLAEILTKISKAAKEAGDGIKQNLDKPVSDLKQDITEANEKLDAFTKKLGSVSKVEAITDLTSGLLQLGTALSSTIDLSENIKNIWQSSDSYVSKLAKTITILSTTMLVIGNAFKVFHNILNSETGAWLLNTLAVYANTKAKENNSIIAFESGKTSKALTKRIKKDIAEESITNGVKNLKINSNVGDIISDGSTLIKTNTIGKGIKTITADFSKLWTLIKTAGSALIKFFTGAGGIVTIAVAAIGLIGYAIYQEAHKAERELENIKNDIKALKEEQSQLNETISSTNSLFESYLDYKKTLDGCTKGTKEWNTALTKVNASVSEIIDKYPELLKIEGAITKNKDGSYSIKEYALNTITDRLNNQANTLTTAAIILEQQKIKKELEIEFEKINRDNRSTLYYYNDKGERINYGISDSSNQKGAADAAATNRLEYEAYLKDYAVSMGFAENSSIYSNFMNTYNTDEMYEKYKKLGIAIDETIIKFNNLNNTNPTPYSNEEQGKQWIWNFNETTDAIYNKILQKENAGVSKFSEEDDADAKEFFAQFLKSQGLNIKDYELENVDGTDNNRKYTYRDPEGKIHTLTNTDMASRIAAGMINGTWSGDYLGYGNERFWNGENGERSLSYIANQYKDEIDKAYNNIMQNKIFESLSEKTKQELFAYMFSDDQNPNLFSKNSRNEILGMNSTDSLNSFIQIQDKNGDIVKEKRGWFFAEELQNKIINNEDEFNKKDKLDFSESANSAIELLKNNNNIEVSKESFIAYSNQLLKENKLLEENTDLLIEVTKRHFILQNSYEKLTKSLKDNEDTLKEWKDGQVLSIEEMNKVGEVIKATKELLGEDVDEDFVKENLNNLINLSSGDATAIYDLEEKYIKSIFEKMDEIKENIITDIEDDSGKIIIKDVEIDKEDIQNSINNTLNDLKLGKIEIGAQVDNENFNNGLAALIASGKYTTDELEKLFNSVGLEVAGYQDVQIPVEKTKSTPVSKFKTSALPKEEEVTTKTIQIPVFKNKGAPTTYANSSAKKSSGSSGGSGPSKDTSQINRYESVEERLTGINDKLDDLSKIEDRLLGNKWIENTNNQLQELNNKLKTTQEGFSIASQEMVDYQNKLSKYGYKFDKNGAITNYYEVYKSQQNKYNGSLTNSAKEYYDEFKKVTEYYINTTLKKYEEYSDEIVEIIDKISETAIKKLKKGMEDALDFKDYTQKWNQFKNEFINGFDSDKGFFNFITAFDDLTDYNRYKTLKFLAQEAKELKLEFDLAKLDGESDTDYKERLTTWLKDAKESIENINDALTDVKENISEMDESHAKILGEINDEVQKQLELYGKIASEMRHDRQLISLIYGEDSYNRMNSFYDKELKTMTNQIELEKRTLDQYKQFMIDAKDLYGEENTEAYKTAEENWKSMLEKMNSDLESAIQLAKDKLANAVDGIAKNIQEKLAGSLLFDYANQEWEMLNMEAEEYLDTINAAFGIQELQNKYDDFINNTDNVKQQQKIKNIMNEEIEILKSRDKLSQYDLDRANLKYEMTMKQIALEEAQQNKTRLRLRRDSQGNYTYQYSADEDEINKIQSELNALQNNLYNLDKEKYHSNLQSIENLTQESVEKIAEIYKDSTLTEEERQQKIYDINQYYGELINDLVSDNEYIKQYYYESTLQSVEEMYDLNYQQLVDMADKEKEVLMSELDPAWTSLYQNITNNLGNILSDYNLYTSEAIKELDQLIKIYYEDTQSMCDAAQLDIEDLTASTDQYIGDLEDLSIDTDILTDKFSDAESQVMTYASQLENLRNVLAGVKEETLELSRALDTYIRDLTAESLEELYAAGDLRIEDINSKIDNILNPPIPEPEPEPVKQPEPVKKANPQLGDYIELKSGHYWYGNSYGGAGSGKVYANRKLKITHYKPGAPYPYNAEGLGWFRLEDIVGYRTGGYTGEWGADGKLAILHQKELVLNEDDTKNLLDSVELLRAIISRNDLLGINTISSIKNDSYNPSQNIVINASFPNAINHNEIEEAFNNLTNMATMRVHK